MYLLALNGMIKGCCSYFDEIHECSSLVSYVIIKRMTIAQGLFSRI